MRIFFDTEFIEDDKTIDPISIGLVREDGQEYYAEFIECDRSKASQWVRENVFPHLINDDDCLGLKSTIADNIVTFVGDKPEFWAYCADYDWVLLCQLYGTMMDLPNGWPMFCMDIMQLWASIGHYPELPKQASQVHNALADARWNAECWRFLQTRPTVVAT